MINPVKGHVYLVSIYNKAVRALVKDNRSHSFFSDLWADARTQDVSAVDEEDARRKMSKRFPEKDGFVIESINLEPQ
jgi:hypothetical protein